MQFDHQPVLLHESIAALHIQSGGIYIDGTAGGGGHATAIAQALNGTGKLICLDQDPDAIHILEERMAAFSNVEVLQSNFKNILSVLEKLEISQVDGVLLDLGVSSHQLDTGERGFSFRQDAPLDMRMSQEGTSAKDLVNTLPQYELAKIFFQYGEEKFSRGIAANIVKSRAQKPIETTFELVDIIKQAIPARARRTGGHPARRVFQALRIAVNGELSILDNALEDMLSALSVGGHLAVITFHSLEDRIVKHKFQEWAKGCICPPEFPICTCGKKPKIKIDVKSATASELELEENPRARSARLRSIEKI